MANRQKTCGCWWHLESLRLKIGREYLPQRRRASTETHRGKMLAGDVGCAYTRGSHLPPFSQKVRQAELRRAIARVACLSLFSVNRFLTKKGDRKKASVARRGTRVKPDSRRDLDRHNTASVLTYVKRARLLIEDHACRPYQATGNCCW